MNLDLEDNNNLNNQINLQENNKFNNKNNIVENMEDNKELVLDKSLSNTFELKDQQKNFLETTLGQTINSGLNIGLRAVLPNFIEDQIIEVKDALLTEGFSEALKTAIEKATELGKSTLGIFTGKFENISQVKNVVKNGGILDSVSSLLDRAVLLAKEKDLINNATVNLIKRGKNVILTNINTSIEDNLTKQVESVENLDKYIENWNVNYKNQNFNNMEKEFKKISKTLNSIMPLETTITRARRIENIHNLIKNNGKNFNLTKEQLELAEKL